MKRLIFLSLMAAFSLATVQAQKTVVSQKEQKPEVFMVVENMPEYPGGNEAMIAFFAKNMKYPADAQKNKVQGRVLVTFVVERDGTITDVQVAKPTFPSLDDEAMRLVKKMPKWKPGTQRGVPVRVKFTLPVVFKL